MEGVVAVPPLRLGVVDPALDQAAASTAVGRSGPGAKRRTYSGKGTPTLTVIGTGRRVTLCENSDKSQNAN